MSPTRSKSRFVAHAALYLALAVLLPVVFHSFGIAGRVFLPMHFPVLLGGFLAGPWVGLVVGLLAPGLAYLMTGMPPTYAVPLMSLELPMYGLVAGLAYNRLRLNVYLSLILALVLGRVMFGVGLLVLGLFMELPYSAAKYFAMGGMVVSGLPGIVLQLVLIPIIVAAVKRGQR